MTNNERRPRLRRTLRLPTLKVWIRLSIAGLVALILSDLYLKGNSELIADDVKKIHVTSDFRKILAVELAAHLKKNELPRELTLPLSESLASTVLREESLVGTSQTVAVPCIVDYTIDRDLQVEAEKLLINYKPDYGAIVILDPDTGQVKALASYQKNPGADYENLALKSSYPAASVFKIITASAAVDRYEISPDTLIMFNGGNHTLYKRNVMNANVNKWTRNMTLREAFARSINTVFARLSFERLQPQDIREYAIRFGFNSNIATDLPLNPSFTEIPDEKNFHLAEMASGYNRITRMSPVQGAMIASAVASDGNMRIPYIVDSVRAKTGELVFKSEPMTAGITLSKNGAERLKELMEATVTQGTGRKSFRSLVRDRKFQELEMGGKTGSLLGDNPKGKVDWFVGYAIGSKSKLAIAAITVNKERWTVKSTFLAQSLFRRHFGVEFSKENENYLSSNSQETGQ